VFGTHVLISGGAVSGHLMANIDMEPHIMRAETGTGLELLHAALFSHMTTSRTRRNSVTTVE
jgi:hypothetical protein